MKFPNMVYRCPGTHQCRGGTFDYHSVGDEYELTQLIKDGWYPTLLFAQDPSGFELEDFLKEEGHTEPEKSGNEDNSPDPYAGFKDLPREELKAKAKKLGVGFNKNTKNETLIERIIQALKDEN